MLDDVERRVLGHLPPWHSDAAHAARLESEGHTAAEAKKVRSHPAGDDPREGTDEDPRIIRGCGFTTTAYTVPQLTVRLKADDSLPLALAKRTIERGDQPEPLGERSVEAELKALETRGFVSADGDRWAMTEAGLAVLTTEKERP